MRKIDLLDKKELLFRYVYYIDVLDKIGSYPLSKDVVLKDLGTTAEIKIFSQRCYRDMRQLNKMFPIIKDFSAIDFLCWISFEYIRNIWTKETIKRLPKSLKDYDKYKNSLFYIAHQHLTEYNNEYQKSKFEPISEFISTKFILLLMICNRDKLDTRNMLRLFNKYPEIFITSMIRTTLDTSGNAREIALIAFNTMQILNFYEYLRDLNIGMSEEKESIIWERVMIDAAYIVPIKKTIRNLQRVKQLEKLANINKLALG